MRFSVFIRANLKSILQDWEEFAKTIKNASNMGATELRDHAREMLLTIAGDLDSYQTEPEKIAKSKGFSPKSYEGSWAELHGGGRQISGFSFMETLSEFRALRASVVAHWTNVYPKIAAEQPEDINRFHEAIDQAIAESLEQYMTLKDAETRLFGAILDTSPDPICVLDLEGRFLFANRAAGALFAIEPKAIVGKNTFDLELSFASDFQRNLEKVITCKSTQRDKFAHDFSLLSGERFEYLLAPVLDKDRITEGILCIARDITQQEIAEGKIWHNAHHDLLTGLPNRRLFLDRLEQEVKHTDRSGRPFSLFFMDLDGFKGVNDSLGHEVGDRLLSEVGERLSGCVRKGDTVARLGGDEFTVILVGVMHREDVERVAKTIIAALAKPLYVEKVCVQISVSIGVAGYHQNASTSAALLKAADQAMYKAKESVHNRIFFSDISSDDSRQNSGPLIP